VAFVISYAIHALTVYGLRWAVLRSETVNVTNSGNNEISGMSWEVEAPSEKTPPQHAPIAAAPHPVIPKQAIEKDDATNTAALPSAQSSSTVAPPHPGGVAAAGSGPPATEVQSYMLNIRKHLSDAIQIHSITGMAPISLILKISIARDGQVTHQEIEKSSGNPEMDAKVLAAFQSIQPLAPFPEGWNKNSLSPQVLTVRLPIEIHSR
jgi:TonB family protein